jgi:hypothetical protein
MSPGQACSRNHRRMLFFKSALLVPIRTPRGPSFIRYGMLFVSVDREIARYIRRSASLTLGGTENSEHRALPARRRKLKSRAIGQLGGRRVRRRHFPIGGGHGIVLNTSASNCAVVASVGGGTPEPTSMHPCRAMPDTLDLLGLAGGDATRPPHRGADRSRARA